MAQHFSDICELCWKFSTKAWEREEKRKVVTKLMDNSENSAPFPPISLPLSHPSLPRVQKRYKVFYTNFSFYTRRSKKQESENCFPLIYEMQPFKSFYSAFLQPPVPELYPSSWYPSSCSPFSVPHSLYPLQCPPKICFCSRRTYLPIVLNL